jgi:hypothetical protein
MISRRRGLRLWDVSDSVRFHANLHKEMGRVQRRGRPIAAMQQAAAAILGRAQHLHDPHNLVV